MVIALFSEPRTTSQVRTPTVLFIVSRMLSSKYWPDHPATFKTMRSSSDPKSRIRVVLAKESMRVSTHTLNARELPPISVPPAIWYPEPFVASQPSSRPGASVALPTGSRAQTDPRRMLAGNALPPFLIAAMVLSEQPATSGSVGGGAVGRTLVSHATSSDESAQSANPSQKNQLSSRHCEPSAHGNPPAGHSAGCCLSSTQ